MFWAVWHNHNSIFHEGAHQNAFGDALTIIKKLRYDEKDKSIVSVLINKIKERINSFRSVEFRYISHQGNEAAHLLDGEGKRYATPMFWIEAPRVVEAEVERNREAMQGAR